MKLSRVSVLFAASIACIALSGLRAPAAPVELNGPDPPDPLPELVYVIETDKSVYRLGEEVHITHRAMNLGDADVTIRFGWAPGFEFVIMAGGETIEPWLEARAPVIWRLTLCPGESYVTEWTWDMTDMEGNPLPLGRYDIVGVSHGGPDPFLPGMDPPDVPVATIAIIAEPAMLSLLSIAGLLPVAKARRVQCENDQ
jgi:hypothetical protein